MEGCSRALYTVALIAACSLGCVAGGKPQPTTPIPAADIPFTVDDREGYARVLRGIVEADLSVELKDADAGIVQTEWHESGLQHIGMAGFIRRRVRFKIIIEKGACRIKPQSEYKFEGQYGTWTSDDGFTKFEADVHEALVGKLKTRLSAPN